MFRATRSLGLGRRFSLQDVLEKADVSKDPQVLWLFEGAAYQFFRSALRRGDHLDNWFAGMDPAHLPLLHISLGLALADPAFRGVRHIDDAAGEIIDHHLELCTQNCAPKHMDSAIEAFGMLARCERPRWTSGLSRAFAPDPRRQRIFWHGAGRGAYFLPVPSLGLYGSFDEGRRSIDAQAPPDAARAALSGLIFAFVSVNLSSPRTVETLLQRRQASISPEISRAAVAASLDLHRRIAHGQNIVRRFLGHKPEDTRFWRRWIVDPERPIDLSDDDLYRSLG